MLKELYLGLHALIREHAEAPKVAKLNGEWVTVDPTTWGERNAMTVEVGLGAAGHEADLASFSAISQDMVQIATMQGGLNGPLLTGPNVYNLLIDKARALRRKQPERYWTNPATFAQPAPQMSPQIQAMLQKNQLAQAQAQSRDQTVQRGQDIDAGLKQQQIESDAALKKYEIDQKTQADIVSSAITARKHDAEPPVGGML
ncbi:MAG: portal protein [Rhizomicrobium sp.]